jgi:hypothetical protein
MDMMAIKSRLRATSNRYASPSDTRLNWDLTNASSETIFIFRDRFDPSEYNVIPDHALTGTKLVLYQGSKAIPYIVSVGGPVGLNVTPKVEHYLRLHPGEAYRYVFKGLNYTVFSSSEPYQHQTFQWARVNGDIEAQVEFISQVHDLELDLKVWIGRALSNKIYFEIE